MKPMLACDWDESKVRFPAWLQPKIDGVRALNIGGQLLGRSLKQHRNTYTTQFYSQPCLASFDGEMAAQSETHADLCRITSSALSTIVGEPYTLWWLFDYFALDMPYKERYLGLKQRVAMLQSQNACRAAAHLRVVPYVEVRCRAELDDTHALWSSQGYEGTIIRDPYGMHKQGRSTVREGGLLRIKDFEDAEAEVLHYLEGNKNGNEAQINELGKTFRTSHDAGMIPNGQVGTIVGRRLDNGQVINVSPGNMTLEQRIAEWNARGTAAGKVFSFKHFPKGVKDKPRFPTWKFWRDATDMS